MDQSPENPFEIELSNLFEATRKLSLLGFEDCTPLASLKNKQYLSNSLQTILNSLAIERTSLITKLEDADKVRIRLLKKYKRHKNPNSAYDPEVAIVDKSCKVLAALLVAVSELEATFKRVHEKLIGRRSLEYIPPNTTASSLIDSVVAARQRLLKRKKGSK